MKRLYITFLHIFQMYKLNFTIFKYFQQKKSNDNAIFSCGSLWLNSTSVPHLPPLMHFVQYSCPVLLQHEEGDVCVLVILSYLECLQFRIFVRLLSINGSYYQRTYNQFLCTTLLFCDIKWDGAISSTNMNNFPL